jgi:hypothetical protein
MSVGATPITRREASYRSKRPTSPPFNPLKPCGNYMYHLPYQSVTLHFAYNVFLGFVGFLK